MRNMERRFISLASSPVTVDKRSDGTATISGYAAVFFRDGDHGTEYQMWSDLVERIDRDAFSRAIKESHDVRALFNHDPSYVLGRSKAGTLRLSVDNVGLRYDVDAPDTTTAKDVIASIERGDVSGSSFAFHATRVEWQVDEKRKLDIRTIKDVDLFDVGPVTFPAYESTTAGLRAQGSEDVLKDRRFWRVEREAAEVRKRLLTIDEQTY